MKRFFIYITTVMLLIMCLPLSICAEGNYDSINIDPQERQTVQTSDDDTVIKLYSGIFIKVFSEKKEINTIISGQNILEEIYMLKTDDVIKYKHFYNDTLVEITQTHHLSGWNQFSTYAISPDNVFDSSVTVNNIYCLSGESSHDGVYIYYVTDKGDYVLYKEYLSSDKEYLFPINDFYDFAKIVYDDRVQNKDMEGSGTPIEELLDLKTYEFDSNAYDTNSKATGSDSNASEIGDIGAYKKSNTVIIVTIIASVIVIGCGAFLAVMLRKKHKV